MATGTTSMRRATSGPSVRLHSKQSPGVRCGGRPRRRGKCGRQSEAAAAAFSIEPRAPPSLCAVIDRALEFDRSVRWASAGEMLEALRLALTAEGCRPVTSATVEPISSTRSDARRRQLVVRTPGAGVLRPAATAAAAFSRCWRLSSFTA